MPPDMNKSLNVPMNSPGYETRDANLRAVVGFLIVLAVMVLGTALICWGMFDYFVGHIEDAPASTSPFAGTRQLPLGPMLQVHARQDLLQYQEEQRNLLETYSWENRSAGTVKVPIEFAMQLLVKEGLPVQQTASSPAAAKAAPAKGKNP